MFAITVEFTIKKERVEEFTRVVMIQAANSLRHETGCHRFDVCVNEDEPQRIFLYELYANEAALQDHRQTDYYAQFNATIQDWVENRDVTIWKKLEHDPSSKDFVPLS
jgi:quinol monooxygenase YgiN